jgi:DNA-binding MarR family transcriptional regulator
VSVEQRLTGSGAGKSSAGLLAALADFRYELRRFLHFSESAALEAGLQPQQHQLLLQVAGAATNAQVTIAYVAGRLALKHNSAVELVDRSEREGLLERTADARDRRCTILHLTRKGWKMLERLSDTHARELHEMGQRLIAALEDVGQHAHVGAPKEAQ